MRKSEQIRLDADAAKKRIRATRRRTLIRTASIAKVTPRSRRVR